MLHRLLRIVTRHDSGNADTHVRNVIFRILADVCQSVSDSTYKRLIKHLLLSPCMVEYDSNVVAVLAALKHLSKLPDAARVAESYLHGLLQWDVFTQKLDA